MLRYFGRTLGELIKIFHLDNCMDSYFTVGNKHFFIYPNRLIFSALVEKTYSLNINEFFLLLKRVFTGVLQSSGLEIVCIDYLEVPLRNIYSEYV